MADKIFYSPQDVAAELELTVNYVLHLEPKTVVVGTGRKRRTVFTRLQLDIIRSRVDRYRNSISDKEHVDG